MPTREIAWATYGVTNVEPLTLILTCILGLWLVGTKRAESAILAFLLVACFIPSDQRLVVAGLDFNMIRIIVSFGLLRMLFRREHIPGIHQIDKAVFAWVVIGAFALFIRQPSLDSVVNRLGFGYEFLGVYLLARSLLHTEEAILNTLKILRTCTIIVAVCMLFEWLTQYNLFSLLGGVPESTPVRDGRLRCQGAFSHPILSGLFGASMFPVALGLLRSAETGKLQSMAALVGSLIIVVTSSSSGPLFALLGGLLAWMAWPFRSQLRAIRWGIVFCLVTLHFIREAPVWHLIGRASDLVGGTGYHRVRLISGFFDNWQEWFWTGVQNTAHWGWGLQDITNYYVFQGVRGGVFTLAAFLFVLYRVFQKVGISLRTKKGTRSEIWIFGLGASMVAHTVGFIGVSYFGQMQTVFALHLSIISALAFVFVHASGEDSSGLPGSARIAGRSQIRTQSEMV